MSKLIKTWDELDGLKNDKYQIVVNKEFCCGWIIPINDERIEPDSDDFICNCKHYTFDAYHDDHEYLGTHTFYGSQYKYSTELLQKFGFDIEIDNWDKKGDRKIMHSGILHCLQEIRTLLREIKELLEKRG